jgi:N-acetylmuramoyl-L-alanine amidase
MRTMPGSFFAAGLLAAIACAPAALATTSGGPRTRTDTIIVHTISGPFQECPRGRLEFSGAPGDAGRWKAFFDRHPFLGIHYVIDRDGRVEASTPENRRANHALNNSETSIGIELVHNGDGPFGPAQVAALIKLLREVRGRHNVPLENVKGHEDVDTRTFTCGGKVYKGRMDPGANFPWAQVRAALRGEPVQAAGPVLLTRPTLVRRAGQNLPPQ